MSWNSFISYISNFVGGSVNRVSRGASFAIVLRLRVSFGVVETIGLADPQSSGLTAVEANFEPASVGLAGRRHVLSDTKRLDTASSQELWPAQRYW